MQRLMALFKVCVTLCFCVLLFQAVISLSCLRNGKIDKTWARAKALFLQAFLDCSGNGTNNISNGNRHFQSEKSGTLGSPVVFWTGGFPRLTVGGERREVKENYKELWILMARREAKFNYCMWEYLLRRLLVQKRLKSLNKSLQITSRFWKKVQMGTEWESQRFVKGSLHL